MRIDLPSEWQSRAIVLGAVEPERDWFTDEELRIAEGFRLEKRRREWLLSRYAAKQLAVERGVVAQPREFVTSRAAVHLSISHSEPYAAAAIDSRPVGIDIQVVRELKESAAHLFLSEAETGSMRSLSIPDRLIHFWCAKEAVWKQAGGAVETLKRIAIMLDSVSRESLTFDRVETRRIGDFVLALTR